MSQVFNRTQAMGYLESKGVRMTQYLMTKILRSRILPSQANPDNLREIQIRQEDIDAWIANPKPSTPDMSKFAEMHLRMRKISKSDSQTKYFLYQELEPDQDVFHFVVADWSGVQHDIILSLDDAVLLGLIEVRP
jgi:hypothetical protein